MESFEKSSEPEIQPEAEKKPTKIRKGDIRPEIPEPGKTTIILQCNAKDDRDPETPKENVGALTEESIKKTPSEAKEFFNSIFDGLDEEEKQKVDVLVVASDAKLITPEKIENPDNEYRRAVDTGNLVIKGLQESMSEHSLSSDQLLNSSVKQQLQKEGPVEMSELKDLLMMEESPEFVEWLKQKCKENGEDFWIEYEKDTYKKEREEMGAEGHVEVADRVKYSMSYLAEISKMYHNANPDRRLIIWAISHYDAISPYVKKHVMGMSLEETKASYLGVEKGGGLAMNVGNRGEDSITEIGGKKYGGSFLDDENH